MILFSTHQKLVKAGALVWRVSFPAGVYDLGALGPCKVSSHCEHFTTRAAADKSAELWRGCSIPCVKVESVRADSYNPLTTR